MLDCKSTSRIHIKFWYNYYDVLRMHDEIILKSKTVVRINVSGQEKQGLH